MIDKPRRREAAGGARLVDALDTTARSIAAVPNRVGTCNLTREKIGNNFRTAKHYSVAGRSDFVRASGFVLPLGWQPDCQMMLPVNYEIFGPQRTITTLPFWVAR